MSTVRPSCATPPASTFLKSQNIAVLAGRLAASLRISSKESSSYHLNWIRPVSGWTSFCTNAFQGLSLAEAPLTIAIVFVRGRTHMLKQSQHVIVRCHDRVVLGELAV